MSLVHVGVTRSHLDRFVAGEFLDRLKGNASLR
jgi:hypothetical protein